MLSLLRLSQKYYLATTFRFFQLTSSANIQTGYYIFYHHHHTLSLSLSLYKLDRTFLNLDKFKGSEIGGTITRFWDGGEGRTIILSHLDRQLIRKSKLLAYHRLQSQGRSLLTILSKLYNNFCQKENKLKQWRGLKKQIKLGVTRIDSTHKQHKVSRG